jgi:hypothetical protein
MGIVIVLGVLGIAEPVLAQRSTWGATFSVTDGPGAVLSVDGRLSWDDVQVGAVLTGGARDAFYLGGYAEHEAGVLGGRLLVMGRLLEAGALRLDLRAGSGLSGTIAAADVQGPHRAAMRWSTELAMLAHVHIDPAWLLRLGAAATFELEVAPAVDVADQAALLLAGIGFAPAPELLVFAGGEVGGSYGFDGDNGKVVFRADLGVRVALDGDATAAF